MPTKSPIARILDLHRFPLDSLDSPEGETLLSRCQAELRREGLFSLPQLLRVDAQDRAINEVVEQFESDGFSRIGTRNVYFRDDVPGLDDEHPALRRMTTAHRTLCADGVKSSVLEAIYEWPPLLDFLARVMRLPRLYRMKDPLARINAMRYRQGQQLGWHLDHSEFTTTLLLQVPDSGGEFEYRTDLLTAEEPSNPGGVARLLEGVDDAVRTLQL